MTTAFWITSIVMALALQGCAETGTYPVSQEEGRADDPVKSMDAPTCLPNISGP